MLLAAVVTAQHTLRLDPSRVRVAKTPLTAELGAEPRDYGPRCHDEPKRRLRALRYCAPSFLIIGFGRCGTTSLARYLRSHPRLTFGTRKEHHYFTRPEHCDLHHGPNTSPRCHVKAYAKQFPIYKDQPEKDLTFDATPLLGGDMGVPASDRTIAWLRSRLPELRLVVLVKSPADRFMSNPNSAAKLARFQASLRRGDNTMPTKLQELLQENCYVDKIEKWLAFFPADRFLLIKSEDLRDEGKRPHILDEMTAFVGAGPHAYAPEALNFLGNYRRASNTTVSPRVRTTLNCLPRLRTCEARLDALIKGGTRLRWCDDARQVAHEMRETQLRRSRVPRMMPTRPPDLASFRRYRLAKRLVGKVDEGPTSAVIVVGEKQDAAHVAQVLARAPGAALVSLDAVGRARGIAVAVAPADASTKTMQELYAAAPALRVVFVGRRPSGSIDATTTSTLVGLRDGDVMPRALDDLVRRSCRVDQLDTWSHAFSPSRVLFVRAEDLSERSYALAEDLFTEISDFVGLLSGETMGVVDAPRAEPLSPEHRVVVDCLPELLSCEKRLEARLQGRPGSIGWCTDAMQSAAAGFDPPRLKSRREKRPGWFGRRL